MNQPSSPDQPTAPEGAAPHAGQPGQSITPDTHKVDGDNASPAASDTAGVSVDTSAGTTGIPPSARPSGMPAGEKEGKPAGEAPRKKRRSFWRIFFSILGLLILLASVTGGYIAWEAWRFLNTPPATPGKDVIVDITPGSTLADAAAQLQSSGVVADALRFQILARVLEQGTKIQAGRFLVNTGWLPRQVLDQLVTGKAMLYRVTIPEGLPWWEVGRTLEREGLCTAADFARVIHEPGFLRHWGIPFPSAEGFLYPDTYFVPKPRELNEQAARAAANRMVDMFWRKAATVWPNGRPDTTTLRRAVTLASIVEKETAVPSERPRVAGVYDNRLKKNMLLQADPTIIYGLGSEFSGPLLRRHLDDQANPYNTYKLAGLPPGPICSPGLSALKAAVTPEQHDFLYFVAKGDDGSHIFSTTLTEHNRAVRAYRETIRRQGE